MTQTKAITDAITTLTDVEKRFGFVRIEDEQFFSEWCEELPNLNETEKENLDVLRRRYIYHRADGNLLEGTVMLLLVSPLLALAGFYRENINGLKPPDSSVDVNYAKLKPLNFIYGALITNYELRITNYAHCFTASFGLFDGKSQYQSACIWNGDKWRRYFIYQGSTRR